MSKTSEKQLLHVVFGGELETLDSTNFADLSAVDVVGLFPSYSGAYAAWKKKAQSSIDNAGPRYLEPAP